MGYIGPSRSWHAWFAVALFCAVLALASAAAGCSPQDYDPYASAEEAATDYATGVLTGDVDMASRAVGAELDEGALARARRDLFGMEEAMPDAFAVVVPGPDSAESPGGRSQDANLFEVDSYETARGDVVAVDSLDHTPEIWVSDTEPWRVISLGSQQAGQLFVKALLLGIAVTIVVVVIVMIRMADRDYGGDV